MSTDQNPPLEHTEGGSHTRTDTTDVGVPMAPAREPMPSSEQVQAALDRPAPVRDSVTRITSMADAVGAEMAAVERLRLGESEEKAA